MFYEAPPDPTFVGDPIALPKRPPGPVLVAGLLMLLGAALGIVHGLAVLRSAGPIRLEFARRASATGASVEQINQAAIGLNVGLIVAGLVAVTLASGMVLAAILVLRGGPGARPISFAVLAASLAGGVSFSAVVIAATGGRTRLGGVDLDEGTRRSLGAALAEALPSWLGSVGGGMLCVQVVGYLIAVVLLLLPVSHAYLRRGPGKRRPLPPPAVPITALPIAPYPVTAPLLPGFDPPGSDPPSADPLLPTADPQVPGADPLLSGDDPPEGEAQHRLDPNPSNRAGSAARDAAASTPDRVSLDTPGDAAA